MNSLRAQHINSPPDSSLGSIKLVHLPNSNIPQNALQKIEFLDFKNTEIKDILRSLATKYNLNIFIDDAITQRITLHLTGVTVHDVLCFIAEENNLKLTLEGSIYKIGKLEVLPPQPKPLSITYDNGRLTIDLKNEEIERVVRKISQITQKNIVLNHGVEGRISGYLQDIPFQQGLETLMSVNGYVVHQKGDIYIVDRRNYGLTSNNKKPIWVTYTDSLITLDVFQANLSDIVREIAVQSGIDIFIYGEISGKVNAHCSGLPFEKALDYLFKGTNYTYRKEGNVYFIGDKNTSGIASIKLVRLHHIKAEGIIELLPPSIATKATLKVIKEHNGLMVIGSQDAIREIEEFIHQIDHPVPQILIEAIVVDYNTSDMGELGLTAGMKNPTDSTLHVDSFFPTVDITASGSLLNQSLHYYGPQLGVKNIGKLPKDFLLRLRALERVGKANIRSQPKIATLNGHPASIKIGTTQYFILESQQPVVGGNQIINQISQRFETITAEISLTITPWVSASGEITTEIHPEFSTPQGTFDPNRPPTINHRILDSTVRLRDGETIVLGGLIQTVDGETIHRFPILSRIPILGRLFQNRSHTRNKAELIIYLTPHLYYSEEVNTPSGGYIR